MKRLISIFWILAALLLLAACQTEEPEPAPPEFETLVVQVTPAVRPVIPAVQACAALLPDIELQVIERFANQAEPGLLIRLGEPEEDTLHLAQIASEEIGVILHPDNKSASLSVDQIRDLFTGKTASWADLGGAAFEVKIWGLYATDESQQAFEREILAGVPLAASAGLAPDPETLGSAVAADPAAIGLMPASWAQEEIKFTLVGLRLPVLVTSQRPLEGYIVELTACLQGETGQTILNAIYP